MTSLSNVRDTFSPKQTEFHFVRKIMKVGPIQNDLTLLKTSVKLFLNSETSSISKEGIEKYKTKS